MLSRLLHLARPAVTGLAALFLLLTSLLSPSTPPVYAATPMATTTTTFALACDGSSGTLLSNAYPFGGAQVASFCSSSNRVEWSHDQAQRTYLSFNTSSIPVSAGILSANLSLFISADIQNDDGTTLEVVAGSQGPVLGADDWANLGSTSFTSRSLQALGQNNTNTFSLNTTALTAIKKESTTQLALRLGQDIAGIQAAGTNYITTALQQGAMGVSLSVTYDLPPQPAQITFAAGWNLVSTPFTLQDPSIASVFAVTPEVTKLYTWQSGAWFYATRNGGAWSGSLTQMVDGVAYWAYATGPGNAILSAKVPQPDTYSYILSPGWNMIGFTSALATGSVSTYLGTLGNTWTSLYRYSPANGYELAKPGGQGFTEMEQGRGYWIYLSQAGTLSP